MVVEIVVSTGFPDVEVADSGGDVRQAILSAEGGHDGRDDGGAIEGAEVAAVGCEGIRHGTSGALMEESDTGGDSHVAGTLGTVVLNDTTLATKVRNGGVEGSNVGGLRGDGISESSDGRILFSDGGGEPSDGVFTGSEFVTEMVEMDRHRRA